MCFTFVEIYPKLWRTKALFTYCVTVHWYVMSLFVYYFPIEKLYLTLCSSIAVHFFNLQDVGQKVSCLNTERVIVETIKDNTHSRISYRSTSFIPYQLYVRNSKHYTAALTCVFMPLSLRSPLNTHTINHIINMCRIFWGNVF